MELFGEFLLSAHARGYDNRLGHVFVDEYILDQSWLLYSRRKSNRLQYKKARIKPHGTTCSNCSDIISPQKMHRKCCRLATLAGVRERRQSCLAIYCMGGKQMKMMQNNNWIRRTKTRGRGRSSCRFNCRSGTFRCFLWTV